MSFNPSGPVGSTGLMRAAEVDHLGEERSHFETHPGGDMLEPGAGVSCWSRRNLIAPAHCPEEQGSRAVAPVLNTKGTYNAAILMR